MPKRVLIDEDIDKVYGTIAYKKAFCDDGNEVVVALDIGGSSKIDLGWGENLAYRVDKARVIGIYDMWGWLTKLKKTYSKFDRSFSYEVGKTYEVSTEKGGGIYVWLTFNKARRYWINEVHDHDERYDQFK